MRNKGTLVATITFFLLVNTTYFWEGKMGSYAMLTFLLMVIYYFAILVLLIRQVLRIRNEKFKNRNRIALIGLMSFVLTTSILFPGGLINFGKFESESLLIAQREGVANCMSTLKLRRNRKFFERNVCFGVTEVRGDYKISGDTIFFENVSLGRGETQYYDFAVINYFEPKGKYIGAIVKYRNPADTIGNPLWIIKNELKTPYNNGEHAGPL